jgi:allophanate hydrolase
VPKVLDFAGDADTPGLFAGAVARLEALGGVAVEVDLTPFVEAAKLLYEGPGVAERWAAVGDFVEAKPESVHPVTRKILEGSKGWDAAATFRAQYRLRELARETESVWGEMELLLLPTTPRLYTVAEVLAEPFGTNAMLGKYTNFMNLLDLCAVAVPAGRAREGRLPWGVTLAAPAGRDLALLELAARVTGGEEVAGPKVARIPVAVCGAHLEGLALHHQLAERGAVLRWKGETAACYRLYAMAGGGGLPPRPALVRDEAGLTVWLGEQPWRAQVHTHGGVMHVFTPEGAAAWRWIDPLAHQADVAATQGNLNAPMPGKVLSFAVQVGQVVSAGQALAVLEAMKMEHTIASPSAGTVAELLYAPGDQVNEGAPLLRLEATAA